MMQLPLAELLAVLFRIGACFMVLPGLSSGRVPTMVRLLAVLGICIALTPVLPVGGIVIADDWALLRLLSGEMAVGLFLGLAVRFYVLALGFIATAVATMVGYGNVAGAGLTDDEPQAAVGTLVTFSALIVLFQFEFHHTVLLALVGSYDLIAPYAPIATDTLLLNITELLGAAFVVVLRLGSPFIAYALIANITIGIVNKLTPAIPIYFVSLPFLIAGGLALMAVLLPSMLMLFAAGLTDLAPFR